MNNIWMFKEIFAALRWLKEASNFLTHSINFCVENTFLQNLGVKNFFLPENITDWKSVGFELVSTSNINSCFLQNAIIREKFWNFSTMNLPQTLC